MIVKIVLMMSDRIGPNNAEKDMGTCTRDRHAINIRILEHGAESDKQKR